MFFTSRNLKLIAWTFHMTFSEEDRRGLAIGSTGRFPGGLAADLAAARLWHSLINHKSVSLDWQRRASRPCSLPPSNSFECRWVDARDSRKERKQPEETVKCSEITNLFRASSAGQFHLLQGIVLSLLTYLSIKLLAPVRLSVAPRYYHQSEYCAKGHHYRLESYINKFSRQIFTWIYCIEREGAWANWNKKIFNVLILAFRHFRKLVWISLYEL